MMNTEVKEFSSGKNIDEIIKNITNKTHDFKIKGADHSFKTYVKYDFLHIPQSENSSKLYYSAKSNIGKLYEILFPKKINQNKTNTENNSQKTTQINTRKSNRKRKIYNKYGDDFDTSDTTKTETQIKNQE